MNKRLLPRLDTEFVDCPSPTPTTVKFTRGKTARRYP